MALRTPLSERIGIEHPVMCAGMGGIGPITLGRLAAAISNAGGLGTIAHPALLLEDPGRTDVLEEQIEQTVEQVRAGIRTAVSLTGKPLAVNVRIAKEQPDAPAVLRAILDERERDAQVASRLRVLTTSGGHPSMFGMNQEFRDAGMLHFHAVSNVKHALTAQAEGMDAVVATGFEAAGHVGHEGVHTFVLVAAVAEAVDIPVLAAGGVVDGCSLAAALVLGAQAGYLGTRFLAAEECEYHDNMKSFLIEANETETQIIPAFYGPARFLRNPMSEHVKELGDSGVPPLERMKIEGDALRRGALDGDIERGLMIGGQGAGRVREVLPAAEIVRQIVAEAEEALGRVAGFRTPAATPA